MVLLPSYKSKSVNNDFFGRKEYIDIFQNKLSNLNKDNIDLIMYHGIGGIGKTTLLNNLYNNYCDNNLKLKINLEESNNVEKFYSNLLRELDKSNIRCFNLKIAYSIYWKKLNPNSSLKDNLLFSTPQWDGVLAIVDDLGSGIGSIFKSLTNSVSFVKEHINKYKNELAELDKLTIPEIEELLPKFFNYDLNEKLKDRQESLIVFLDTYEYLYETNKKEINKLKCDKFIRDLVLSTYEFKTLFVFVGREKLIWNKENNEWDDYIYSYNLDSFSYEESIQFLELNGIDNLDIAKSIASYTEGVPFYLNLELNTYKKLENPTIQDFNGKNTKLDIFNRFLLYTSDIDLQLIKTLSLTLYFDIELFEGMIKELHIPVSLLVFDDFVQNSFIKEDNGKYYIHNLMKSAISVKLNDSLKYKILNYLKDYYTNDIEMQLVYAKLIYDELELKNYVTRIYYDNINEYNKLNNFFNILLDSEYEKNIENYYIILDSLLQVKYNNDIKLYNNINDFSHENNNIKMLLKYYNYPDKNFSFVSAINVNEFKNMDLNLYITILNKFINSYRKEKKYNDVEMLLIEVNDIISNNNLEKSVLFDFYSKISLFYKGKKDFNLALEYLSKAKNEIQNKEEKGVYHRNMAELYSKKSLNNMSLFKENISIAINLFDNHFNVLNEESLKCYSNSLINEIDLNMEYYKIYKDVNLNKNNLTSYVVDFLNKNEDIYLIRNFIDFIFRENSKNKYDLDFKSIISLLKEKFDNILEFNIYGYLYFYSKKDYNSALIYVKELYNENKSFNNFVKLSLLYKLINKDEFYKLYSNDIDLFSFNHKLEIYKILGNIDSIFSLLKEKNKLHTILNFINKDTSIEFLLKNENELSNILKEKMDVYYSYIIEKQIKDIYLSYLFKQYEIRVKYNMSTIYKALFYIGKEYYFNKDYINAKLYLNKVFEIMKNDNIIDNKIFIKVKEYLGRIK